MFKEFKKFILRGNLIDLAIGFTVGASFSTVAKSLVNDIIMPPISALLGQTDFSNTFMVLRQGLPSGPYQTLAEASEAGAVTLNYGVFFNNVLALLIVAFAMFMIIKAVNKLQDELIDTKKGAADAKKKKNNNPTDKKCPFCFTIIDFKATRCPACTSKLD